MNQIYCIVYIVPSNVHKINTKYCIVCPSIYGFLLPLCYLQTLHTTCLTFPIFPMLFSNNYQIVLGAVMTVIVWQLDLQLPMKSMPITTDCEFEFRSGRGVQHYVIKFVSDLRQVSVFFRVTTVSSTNKPDRHDITKYC